MIFILEVLCWPNDVTANSFINKVSNFPYPLLHRSVTVSLNNESSDPCKGDLWSQLADKASVLTVEKLMVSFSCVHGSSLRWGSHLGDFWEPGPVRPPARLWRHGCVGDVLEWTGGRMDLAPLHFPSRRLCQTVVSISRLEGNWDCRSGRRSDFHCPFPLEKLFFPPANESLQPKQHSLERKN